MAATLTESEDEIAIRNRRESVRHRVIPGDEPRRLRLLCILAHPDDESMGLGGILAKYGAEGVDTYLITATRGERGWSGTPGANPGPEALGRIRDRELRAAASVLGIREAVILDYVDGELESADQSGLLRELVGHIRRIRPDVVVTFDQNGIYGHPDHIVVTRATTAAIVAAAAANVQSDGKYASHTVNKLYYFAWTREVQEAYEQAFGELRMVIDGVERHAVVWPHWAVSAAIDTSRYWERVWAAIRCHRSQLPGYQKLLDLPDAYHQALWGRLTFHRVFSLAPANDKEDDLFAGLRNREGDPVVVRATKHAGRAAGATPGVAKGRRTAEQSHPRSGRVIEGRRT